MANENRDTLYPAAVVQDYSQRENIFTRPSDADTRMAIRRMEGILTHVAQVFLSVSERVQVLETILKTKISITGAQAKTIHYTVRGRAREFCDVAHVSYKVCGRMVRRAIWRDFFSEFSISSAYDLPANQFSYGLDFIKGWTSYAMAKKLNQLAKGGGISA